MLVDHVFDNVYAERAVLGGENNVEKEQLSDHVQDVATLVEEEENDQIVTESVWTIQQQQSYVIIITCGS